MTINTGYVAAGIKTVDEARAEIGLGPVAGGEKPTPMPQLMQRGYDPNEPRDENGRWTTGGASTTADATSTITISDTMTYADEAPDDPLGKRPPAPLGYDPNTRTQQTRDGKVVLTAPDGTTYTEHIEDAKHWAHWDVQGPENEDLGRYPKKAVKPWANQKRPPYNDQSLNDPSGELPDWTIEPTYIPFNELQPGSGGGGGLRNHQLITPALPEEDEAD